MLNLLCEQIEFAPCTEHNRLSTYDPHLQALKAETRMATCVGMELTGTPLPLNHQNAFPLIMRPHTQDGGGPTADEDPAIQIARLAMWDQGSDKLVQVNHPDMGWMFRDRNGDGTPDSGFTGMFGHIDVIEVHPPHAIFGGPTIPLESRKINAPIHNWLQLLNQGRRIPGVVNTDAHYNFHGSGWLRNYVKSSTDDPASIKTLDVVHAAEMPVLRGMVTNTIEQLGIEEAALLQRSYPEVDFERCQIFELDREPAGWLPVLGSIAGGLLLISYMLWTLLAGGGAVAHGPLPPTTGTGGDAAPSPLPSPRAGWSNPGRP